VVTLTIKAVTEMIIDKNLVMNPKRNPMLRRKDWE
jgi:hypothetical protein